MSNPNFVSKYKNLCTDKTTYIYTSYNNKFEDTNTNYNLKECEKICDAKSDCYAFFNFNNSCFLYASALDSSGIDNDPNMKYISCSKLPNYFLPDVENVKEAKDLYVDAKYYKKNKDKFEHLNPTLKHSQLINEHLKEIDKTKKELANTSNSRNYLYNLYDNVIFYLNSIATRLNLDRNYLNSHLVNKDAYYSINLRNNKLDNEKDLNYIKYINKLDDKMKIDNTLKQQKIVTQRSFTTKFIYYIVLALIMTISLVITIVYFMARGVISDLNNGMFIYRISNFNLFFTL